MEHIDKKMFAGELSASDCVIAEQKDTVNKNVEYRFNVKSDSVMKDLQLDNPLAVNYGEKNADFTYGEIIKTGYYSTTCEKERNVIILTPENYSKEKKYPVCYVLHGIFGDETSMIGDGENGIRIISGNMMRQNKMKETILVFPYMFASKTKDVCDAISVENAEAYDNFVNDLTNDLMPFIEKNFSVATGRENTAVIGFSMGGRESLAIGNAKSELFGYIGAISPAPGLTPGQDWAMLHPGQFKEEELNFSGDYSPLLLMICCGDKDSVVGEFPKSYHAILERNDVEHYWWEIAGSDHGDPAITNGLVNFFKTIFI